MGMVILNANILIIITIHKKNLLMLGNHAIFTHNSYTYSPPTPLRLFYGCLTVVHRLFNGLLP